MKKLSLFLFVVGISLLFQTCSKKENVVQRNNDSPHSIVPMNPEMKESGTNYLMSTVVGHSSSDCGGRCISLWGKSCHIDCMGYGHYCAKSTSIVLRQTSTDIIATTTDTFGLTTDDFFNMPDRSLSYTDEENNRVYLNIPAQLVFRDTATQQFTFTGLFFTTVPE